MADSSRTGRGIAPPEADRGQSILCAGRPLRPARGPARGPASGLLDQPFGDALAGGALAVGSVELAAHRGQPGLAALALGQPAQRRIVSAALVPLRPLSSHPPPCARPALLYN